MARAKTLRTGLLLLVAFSLLFMGLSSAFRNDQNLSLGPSSPMAPVLPRLPSDSDALLFPVTAVTSGLRPDRLGMPYRIAGSRDRVYVADAFAIAGIIKVFDLSGQHINSFGTLGVDDLSFVIDLDVDTDGNLVVLDATPSLHLFSPEGQHLHRIDIVSSDSNPELAWAKAVYARNGEYFVLCLGSLLRVDTTGQLQNVYPRRVDVYQFSTSPSEYYLGPSGLVGSREGLWVADSVMSRLVLLDWDGNFMRELTIPGEIADVPAYPTSMAADSEGNLYVVDAAQLRILKLSHDGQLLWDERVSGSLTEGHPEEVLDIALVGEGLLLVSNSLSQTLDLWDISEETPIRLQVLVTSQYTFLYPRDVVLQGETLYVLSGGSTQAGMQGHAIYTSTVAGSELSPFASSWGGEPLISPAGLAIYDDKLYVLDALRILSFDLSGQELSILGEDLTDWGGFSGVTLFGEKMGPQAIAISREGEIYVADTFGHRIVVFNSQGTFLRQIGLAPEIFPTKIQFLPDRALLVLNSYEGQVLKVEQTGKVLATISSAGSQPGQLGVISDMGRFDGARGLVVDDNGSFYVVDTYNSRILKFSSGGEFEGSGGQFGSSPGDFYLPSGAFLDRSKGLLYLADTSNHRVQVMIIPR